MAGIPTLVCACLMAAVLQSLAQPLHLRADQQDRTTTAQLELQQLQRTLELAKTQQFRIQEPQLMPQRVREEQQQMLQAIQHDAEAAADQGSGAALTSAEQERHTAAFFAASEQQSLLSSQKAKWPDGYIAICAIVKDQRKDLRYWIEYHRWIGIDKFYIFDHNSSRSLLPGLMDYARTGVVEYQYFAGRPRTLPSFADTNQYRAYQACIKQHASRHRWLAFLDADEFVVFQPHAVQQGITNVNVLLPPYEKYGGLALNWMLFGSSGHVDKPKAGLFASYTSCVPQSHTESTHVKVSSVTRWLQLQLHQV